MGQQIFMDLTIFRYLSALPSVLGVNDEMLLFLLLNMAKYKIFYLKLC